MAVNAWRKSKTLGEACRHAWDGIRVAVIKERNVRIQLAVYGLALIVGALVLPVRDVVLVIIVSSTILALEMVNTAIESLADVVDARYHEALRTVKDLTAGAVLVVSAAAVVGGLLLFVSALVY